MTRAGETRSQRVRAGHEHTAAHEVSNAQLLDRAARERAAEARTVTGKLLGDPPVGHSARDRAPIAAVTPTLSRGEGSPLKPRGNRS